MSLHDEPLLTPRRATLLTYAFLGLFALLSAGSLVGSGTPPWGVVAGSAVLAALAAGPIAWLARDRIPAPRRETLGRILLIVSLPAFALVVGVFAVAGGGSLLSVTDAVVVGVVCGGAVALLAERTLVPERYRAERA
ncbi:MULTISPECIES: hypothetical protein [Halorubrum]|uniref:Uncharacterized protein n=1 Tax=Halorubrum hochstenium ATCC 700873 TaxID=1227481 RepID=M0FKI6_9EURY|nr:MULTISPECIES: hypothetical protein [Halorubrum]ELZ59817.1 hypothetical protein C467_03091 [Halorubrum hochstenium ATCC 700873]